MPLMTSETVHETVLETCRSDIPALRAMFETKSDHNPQTFNVFAHYSASKPLKKLRRAMEEAVGDAVGTPHKAARGWVKSLEPGESVPFHAHDHKKRLDPDGTYPLYHIGVFYTVGFTPITFFPYHQEPRPIRIEPGKFIVFRSDFHHAVPPTTEFRQCIGVDFGLRNLPEKLMRETGVGT